MTLRISGQWDEHKALQMNKLFIISTWEGQTVSSILLSINKLLVQFPEIIFFYILIKTRTEPTYGLVVNMKTVHQ